eukprot:NODE_211_length_14581_cov_0.368941.p2 type:complete len:320 gc:universal NODE_211_length_14581_cov_0.368941:2495-1536(-)
MSLRIGIIGLGTVGSALIDMFIENKVAVSVICSSKLYCLAPSADWRNELKQGKGVEEMKMHTDVIIDCTANEDIALQYLSWNKHIIAANKKGFSGDLQYYKLLASSPKKIYFESSCGAGLPIIRTLSDMVKSGDQIHMIEGVLSGTLSYIFNNLSENFSEVVLKAKKLGYTEPDPRDDLNGIDVMRKMLILGRVCNLDLEAAQIQVENIVPEPLRDLDLTDFLTELPTYDEHFHTLAKNADQANKKLSYVGKINFKNLSATVSLCSYDKSHVLARLEGSDNLVKITSKRFPTGLVIQGSGAGAEVTAFGCYSDFLRIRE